LTLYDDEWASAYARRAEAAIPGREGLYRLCRAHLADLEPGARVLVVGCGTGEDLLPLARALPAARFVGVEPAEAMLAYCEQRVRDEGLSERVTLHATSLEGFAGAEPFDAATAVLVSQHVHPDEAAAAFFTKLASLLRSGSLLFSADLHIGSGQDRRLILDSWRRQALLAGIEAELVAGMLERFGSDLAPRDEATIAGFLRAAGFVDVHKVFASLIYGAWAARRG
jgi:tRNA (cmo5U34)-methyltransferase